MWTAFARLLFLGYFVGASDSSPLSVYSSDLQLREKIRYEVSVLIGSPPQEFTLAVDTTLPDIILLDTECSDCKNAPKFDRNESLTYQSEETGRFFNVPGIRGKDVVSVGELTVSDQDLITLTSDPGSLMHSPIGVLV